MLRDAYFLPEPPESIELRAFTHGLMPRTVPRMMQHFIEDWQRRGVDAWNEIPDHWGPDSGVSVGWWTLPAHLGDRFIAPLLGAPPGTCLLQPNVHWTIQCLLSCRELFSPRRNKVVLTEGEFPSVLHSVQQWADLYGLDVHLLPLKGNAFPEKELLEAIDARTALVLLSHVGFTTGEKITDTCIREVSKSTHRHGGLLAVDGYHSIGAATTPVVDLGVDLYFGGLLKEASGSSGSCFVYIRDGLDISPRMTGWFGDAAPFSFNTRPEPHPEVRTRFLGGTTAIAPLYHAVEGLRLLLDAGLSEVRRDSLHKTDYCIERALEMGLTVYSPQSRERRSAMTIFAVPDAALLSLYLKTRHIYTDSRKGALLRMAPFVWNTMEELERCFNEIETALRTRSYLEMQRGNPGGPVT